MIDSNVYVLIIVSAVTNIPGVNLPATEVTSLQLLLGGRWFEFPKSLLDTLAPTPSATAEAQSVKDAAAARAIFDELSNLISTTNYTTLPNGGYSQTGTLLSVANAVLPPIESLSGRQIPTTLLKGTYTLTVTGSGSAATAGSIAITGPSSVTGDGNASVGLTVSVAHASDSIDAPTGATVITQSLLQGLISQAG